MVGSRSWRLVGGSVAVMVMVACGSDDTAHDGSRVTAGAPPSTTTTAAATATATATAVPATTSAAPAMTSGPVSSASSPTSGTAAAGPLTAVPGSGPDSACAGGSPLTSAYDRADGAPVWTVCSPGGVQPALIGATDDVVVTMLVPEYGSPPTASLPRFQLVVLDAATGAERWRVDHSPFSFPAPGPVAGSDTIVAVLVDDSGGQSIAGLSPADGTVRWTTPVEGEPSLIASSDDVVVVTDPGAFGASSGPVTGAPMATMVDGGDGSDGGRLEAYVGIDRATGDRLWTTKLGAPDTMVVPGPPRGAAGEEFVVVPLGPAGLDLRTGALRWTANLPPNEHPQDPAPDTAIGPVVAGMALFGGQDKPFVAIDAATGEQRWTGTGSPPYDNVWAVDDGAVYLVEDGELVAHDLASGAVRWRQPQGEGYVWPWIADGGTVFSMWWNLEARAADTGVVRWSTEYPTASSATGGQRMVSAVSNAASVFVGLTDGTVGGD